MPSLTRCRSTGWVRRPLHNRNIQPPISGLLEIGGSYVVPPERGRYASIAATAAAKCIAAAGAVAVAADRAAVVAAAVIAAAVIAAAAGAGTGHIAAAAGIAAGICHKIREPDPAIGTIGIIGTIGVTGVTGVAGHKKVLLKRYRGGVCLHDILCQRSFFVYSQLSMVPESPRFTMPAVPGCFGLGHTSRSSVTAPFTGGTGQSRSSWAAESSCFFFIVSPRS